MTTDHIFEQPPLTHPFQSIREVLNTYKDRHPDKIALFDLDQDKSISWGQLHDWANRVARYLESRGIKKSDRVGLLSDESIDRMIIWMGIWRLGAVVCPLNVEINVSHISSLLQSIEPEFVLCHTDLDMDALTAGLDCEKMVFSTCSDDMTGNANADEFFAAAAGFDSGPEVASENDANDMSCIFCTSGTTSRPKCVIYDHMAYWMN